MGRDLHRIAFRLREEAGLLDGNGRLVDRPVDVEKIAEGLGLRIVGAEREGVFKLPRWRKGEIRINRRLLVVRPDLLDDDGKVCQLLEVIAHEVSHDVMHGCHMAQRPLPFGNLDARQLALGRMSFGATMRDSIEREAIYLGALIQVPLSELRSLIDPHVREYALGSWSRMTSRADIFEVRAANLYSRRTVGALVDQLSVTRRTAKFALDYWGALSRPPRAWIKEVLEARETSLR
jgi:hypothetical protein